MHGISSLNVLFPSTSREICDGLHLYPNNNNPYTEDVASVEGLLLFVLFCLVLLPHIQLVLASKTVIEFNTKEVM